MTFIQAGTIVPCIDRISHESGTCFGFNLKGHYHIKRPHVQVQFVKLCGSISETDTSNDGTLILAQDEETETSDTPVEENGVFIEFGFLQFCMAPPQKKNIITLYLILFDRESTVCTFSNCGFLQNIRPHSSGRSVEVHTNGGTTHILWLVTQFFGEVWYNPDSITNIISLS